MNLTESQKEAVAGWVADGLKLGDIQSLINKELGATLTYMDVRFLLDDLNLEIKDQPKPVDSDLRNAPPLPQDPTEAAPLVEENKHSLTENGVQVSLHRVYKPGTVVSGVVVFSDGVTAEWSLDQIGQLALNPSTPSYQPNEEDIQDFQKKLGTLLQSQGY